MADQTVRFVIKRQATPQEKPHWEEFDLRWRPGMNVITGLMDIAENPVDRFGKMTTPVTYDSNCLEEVCGSCAMLINGRGAGVTAQRKLVLHTSREVGQDVHAAFEMLAKQLGAVVEYRNSGACPLCSSAA